MELSDQMANRAGVFGDPDPLSRFSRTQGKLDADPPPSHYLRTQGGPEQKVFSQDLAHAKKYFMCTDLRTDRRSSLYTDSIYTDSLYTSSKNFALSKELLV